ncbi:MAG: 5-formyltetrahydrofolate cyclo-ligase [Phycisphaera sp.]|nr:5-formyltetrahydrofolate cyclo-ligase [Phycisphaera sp.]
MVGAPEKKNLRAQLRAKLMELEPAELHAKSVAAAERLAATPEFQRAESVMIFLPLKYEIDARPIALRAWQRMKTVTVPLVSYEQKHMIPVVLRSLDEPMNVDRYGVSTPGTGKPIPPQDIDMVIVPGLGFDVEGRRIGRGGGFYDRFLAHPSFTGITCGLALDEQIVDEVPTACHDVSLDLLVTDRRELRFDRIRA